MRKGLQVLTVVNIKVSEIGSGQAPFWKGHKTLTTIYIEMREAVEETWKDFHVWIIGNGQMFKCSIAVQHLL